MNYRVRWFDERIKKWVVYKRKFRTERSAERYARWALMGFRFTIVKGR